MVKGWNNIGDTENSETNDFAKQDISPSVYFGNLTLREHFKEDIQKHVTYKTPGTPRQKQCT